MAGFKSERWPDIDRNAGRLHVGIRTYTSGMINTYDNVQFKYGYIEATAASELLSGSDGADTIFGGGGNDYIDGGVGANAMIGGQGNDTFVVDTTSDQIIESGVFAYC